VTRLADPAANDPALAGKYPIHGRLKSFVKAVGQPLQSGRLVPQNPPSRLNAHEMSLPEGIIAGP